MKRKLTLRINGTRAGDAARPVVTDDVPAVGLRARFELPVTRTPSPVAPLTRDDFATLEDFE